MKFNTKHAGLVMIALAILMFTVVYSLTLQLNELLIQQCEHAAADFCPHTNTLPAQSYIGFTLVLIAGIFGLLLTLSGRRTETEVAEKKEMLEKSLSSLESDERKVYETLAAQEGVMFQSELTEKLGFTKVKVTRILDRLEGKGLLERRRRGMSNVVVLKHK